MRIRVWQAAAAGLCLLWGAPGASADDKPEAKEKAEKAEGMPWAKSFAEAKERARKDKMLIMADFYTDW